MRPLALTWRLSLLMGLATAISITVICAIVYRETRELYYNQTDRGLAALAQAADEVADTADPATLSARLNVLFPTRSRRATAVVRVWDEADGSVAHAVPASGIDWDKTLSATSRPGDGKSHIFTFWADGQEYRGIWLRPGGGHRSIVIAQGTKPVELELRELLRNLLWIGAAVVGAMVGVVVLLVHVGLRPIHVASGRLREIDVRNLAAPGPGPGEVVAELSPFVDSLRQMLERLQGAMRRQKAFIADASHELRTPVTAAKSTIQTTLGLPRSAEEYRQSLAEALEDLRRMEHLVDELLLLARLDDSAAVANHEPVAIDRLLGELAEAFGPRVAESGSKLVCSLAPANVAGDASQLTRMLSNLLDNALRYGPKGGAIHLTTRSSDGRVVIVVKDEGGRIPADAIPRLFERFFRVDGSRTSSTGGTGLGLAIAREIAQRHDGSIEITSDPASGTQVIVTLPTDSRADN